MRRLALAERVLRRSQEDEAGCWVFTGAVCPRGYGRVGSRTEPGQTLTHRVVYEFLIGPIPDGLVLDHLCRNRRCCNPWHLEPVTAQVNTDRGLRSEGYLISECKNGHRYTPANTGRNAKGRMCLACRAAGRERETAKRKGVAA